jgi:hypothetical protein
MEGPTKATGLTIKCTAEALTLGKTGENMKESISLIKNMDLVLIHGKMEENILANGKIVKDMVGVKLSLLMALKDKAYGKMMLK